MLKTFYIIITEIFGDQNDFTNSGIGKAEEIINPFKENYIFFIALSLISILINIILYLIIKKKNKKIKELTEDNQ